MNKLYVWSFIESALKKDGISKILISQLKQAYLKNVEEAIIVETPIEYPRELPDLTADVGRDFIYIKSNTEND